MNQFLETYLRCFVHACPTKLKQWSPWLNSGIAQVSTKLLAEHHLTFCMDTVLVILDYLLMLSVLLFLILMSGCQKDHLCKILFANTCSMLRQEWKSNRTRIVLKAHSRLEIGLPEITTLDSASVARRSTQKLCPHILWAIQDRSSSRGYSI